MNYVQLIKDYKKSPITVVSIQLPIFSYETFSDRDYSLKNIFYRFSILILSNLIPIDRRYSRL